jgi:outer membrane protein TolC
MQDVPPSGTAFKMESQLPLFRISMLIFFLSFALAAANATVDSSSLTLERCFALALSYNTSLRNAVHEIEITDGEATIARSRLLPQINLLGYDTINGYGNDKTPLGDIDPLKGQRLDLTLQQRLIEFGPTSDAEYARLRRRLEAMYAKEDKVVEVFSDIRGTYFTLRIIDDQLVQHDSLLALFQNKLAEKQSRQESGVGHKTETLAARLTCLDEQERILDLKTRKLEQLVHLKTLLGLDRIPDSVAWASQQQMLSIGADSCVKIAMENSTDLSNAREEVAFAKRKLIEWGWSFAPQVGLSAAVVQGTTSAGLELGANRDNAAHQWALDAFGKEQLYSHSDDASASVSSGPELRYTARLVVDLPVFTGLQRKGEFVETGARYNQARTSLIARTRELEQKVRVAMYQYERSLKQLQIQHERIDIDRERYDLAETQYSLGRIDEDAYDNFRVKLFQSQDSYFNQQFRVLETEEALRAAIRKFD